MVEEHQEALAAIPPHEDMVIRGGALLWSHVLIGWGLLGGAAVLLVSMAAMAPFIDLRTGTFWPGVLATVWMLLMLPIAARIAISVRGTNVVIRNGFYTHTIKLSHVDRVTRQYLPLGGGGRGWEGCLAIWESGAKEGWPCLATMRLSEGKLEAVAEKLRDGMASAGRGRPRFQRSIVNRGWRPGAASARTKVQRGR
jgi:hypothetical protein